MNLKLAIRLALRALGKNKMRTFLTTLGIVIGVGAVIAMLSIGQGAKASIESNIASMGTNTIFIMSGTTTSGGARGGMGMLSNLTENDLQAIRQDCPAVAYVTPNQRTTAQVVAGNQNWSTTIYGVAPEFSQIRNWNAATGTFFSDDEVRANTKACLLGQAVAEYLFGARDPIGEVVRINNVPFRVVGVLESKGEAGFGGDQDDCVIVPYTTHMKRLGGATNFRSLIASAISADAVVEAQEQITTLLRQRHRIRSDQDDDFFIRTQTEISEQAAKATGTMLLLLGGIASVSLLVGGIGIMNIMLVSVTERVREIGIRMALGARGRDILLQFLTEAVTLSCVGGLIGIGVGSSLAIIMAKLAHWPSKISLWSIVLAFIFASATGIFFGFYPALNASRLDPIQALRHE